MGLPAALRVNPRRVATGLRVRTDGRPTFRPLVSLSQRGGLLIRRLAPSVRRLEVTVADGALTSARPPTTRARPRRAATLRFGLTITAVDGRRDTLTLLRLSSR